MSASRFIKLIFLSAALSLIIGFVSASFAATFDSDIVPVPGSSIRLGIQPNDISSINNTIFFNNQNVGIGTSPFTPTERLVIDGGGLKFASPSARPGCGSTTRGLIWANQPGGAVGDTFTLCVRQSSGAFAWQTLGVTADPTLPVTLGLQLWLKADAITGLNDGDPVATWPDSSGLGNNATQTTASLRPQYRANVLNSKPVVRFPNTATSTMSLTTPINASGSTVFVVTKWNNLNYYSFAIGLNGGSEGFLRNRDVQDQILRPQDYVYTTLYQNGTPKTLQPPSNAWFNNSTTLSFSVYGMVDATTTYAVKWLGWNEANNQAHWSGDIAEIVMYNRNLSAVERQSVEQYLGSKYGIVVQ